MTAKIKSYLPFYLGCQTNMGKLVGISSHKVLIESAGAVITEYDSSESGSEVKPYLKKINDLSDAESLLLIDKGFSIGRPRGYSFSPDAFLYLLSLHVDLFKLIDSGLAIHVIKELP